MNAVIDALEPYGVRHADMPLTPSRVWEAMRGREAALLTMTVTGLVLAAGGSRRLGRPKQLLPVGDSTLLDATLASVRRCGLAMTPTQLRAFAAVVRLGSVKAAAAELLVTEAAVSLHVGQLRKELGDQLFTRTSAGLAFTPGGLRLASRAVELLGLQDRTVLEVRAAGEGRRLLRLGTSTLFAEYAAPGLIGLFAERAKDLDVELSTHRTTDFESLLMTRTVDATIGPRIARPENTVDRSKLFLNYQVIAVTSPDHPLLRTAAEHRHAAPADLAARPVGRRGRRA